MVAVGRANGNGVSDARRQRDYAPPRVKHATLGDVVLLGQHRAPMGIDVGHRDNRCAIRALNGIVRINAATER